MFFRSWLEVVKLTLSPISSGPVRRRSALRKRASSYSVAAQVEVMEERRLLSAGTLDPTFGSGGTVTTNFDGATGGASVDLAVSQVDGKAIMVVNSGGAAGPQMVAVRYNTDGSLDNSFGKGGVADFNFDGPTHPATGFLEPDRAAAAALDSAGRLVVVGSTWDASGGKDFAVTRLNIDGSVDAAFGNNGVVTVNFGQAFGYNPAADEATSLAMDATGRIVVAGNTNSNTFGSDFALARLNANGSLDTTFGSSGITTVTFGPGTYRDYARNVAVDASGRIVVEGYTDDPVTTNFIFAVARLETDGTPDANFGTGGAETVRMGPGYEYPDSATAIAVDAAGRILVAGNPLVFDPTRGAAYPHISLARLNAADGSLDGSFGSAGVQTISFGAQDSVTDVTIDTAGQIVLAGSTVLSNSGPAHNNYTYSKFAAARLNGADGSLDSSFGTNGETTIDAGLFSGVSNVAIDPTGRILFAGNSDSNLVNGGVSTNPAVARLTAAGVADSSFGKNGLMVTQLTGPQNDVATGLVVTQADGTSVVVGTSGAQFTLAVARYKPDGSLDSSFGNGGRVTLDYASGFGMTPTAVSVDHSGRIVVAGNFPNTPLTHLGQSMSGGVLRLNVDGSIDTTFGVGGMHGIYIYGVRTMAVDSVGRIVIGQDYAVSRLNADGSTDASFGYQGSAAISSGGANLFNVTSGLALDSADRIVVLGNLVGQNGVVRFTTDGTLDTNFGTGGETLVNFGSGLYGDTARAVAIDSAGRIDVAGTMRNGSTGNLNAGVIQLSADGLLNTGFGNGGKTVFGFGSTSESPVNMAIDAAGRIAVASSGLVSHLVNGVNSQAIVDVFKPDGRPDVDFGIAGQVASSLANGTSNMVAGVAFDASGRLMVASTAATLGDLGYNYLGTSEDFVVTRYLGHDPVIEAGSGNLAAQLQAAVVSLQTSPLVGTPRVVIHADNPAEMSSVVAALAGLNVNSAGPTVEILLDLDAGAYRLDRVSVPAGLRLILDGDGGAAGTGSFASNSSGPALSVVSGDVVIRDGAVFTGNGNFAAIVVQGGRVTVRNSTITETTTTNHSALVIKGGQVDLGTSNDPGLNTIGVNGTGDLIRLTGTNNVMAIGNTFQLNGQTIYDGFQIEDLILDSLHGLNGGTVYWMADSVFVSAKSGNMQRGVDAVPVGGTVYVQTGVAGAYNAGSKLLTIAFDNGLMITQQADTLDTSRRSLIFDDSYGPYGIAHVVKFTAGKKSGEIDLKVDSLPTGTFLPNARLIAYGGDGDAIQVDSNVFLSAWLFGGNSSQLKGGSGNNVLIAGSGSVLVGGLGRSLLIGSGSKLQSTGGQDILISGYSPYSDYYAGAGSYSANEVALGAIMAEWTSNDSRATRIANLSDNTTSPLFSASRKNGDYFLIGTGPNQTVFNDYVADTVSVSGSTDWIFAGSDDSIKGLTTADVLFIYGA